MKRYSNFIWIFLVVFFTIGCFISNLSDAWIGGPAKFIQFLMTAVYTTFWVLFTFNTRSRITMVWISVVMSTLTFIGSVSSLLTRLLHNGFVFSAILSTFASVPFYGLRLFMDWTPVYAITSAISLLWLIYSLKNLYVIRTILIKRSDLNGEE